MSTSRATFGALLSTVSTTANTVTKSLDVVTHAVSMASAFVQNAAQEQQLNILADKETFIEDLIRRKAKEQTDSTIAVQEFISLSKAHADAYESAYTKYTGILRTK